MKKIIFLLSLLIWITAGCGQETTGEGNQEKQEVNESYGVVEIENNGRTLQFVEIPKRAVTLNQHVTEIMLALGLEDHMVGTAYIDDEILDEYKAAYESIPVIADQYPSQEVFLEQEPDFAYAGWASAFREDNIGTVEQLEEFGIHAYLHESSTIIGPTVEDIYTDIRNIGKIFKVEDRAEALIEEMKARIEKKKEEIPQGAVGKQVFIYDNGEAAPFTSARNFLNELISITGAENVFADIDKNWAEVSWEEVVERNPDIIVIIDYGETTIEEKKNFLLNHPALTDVPAVKNEQFIVIPLSSAAEGVRIPDAFELLVDGLIENGF
ncbi:ABC transporter substrate-binding protein [Alkalihalobacterium bogoriense]|uniref:ABC transporter substrate-binding protein n=1 Tax=Alkalihalobacterium bogoriense TaxID=246272 RepID=UPI00054D416A|nr:ABC transporter substrate-binding protein [Alkalihalobacterium bogoriense]